MLVGETLVHLSLRLVVLSGTACALNAGLPYIPRAQPAVSGASFDNALVGYAAAYELRDKAEA